MGVTEGKGQDTYRASVTRSSGRDGDVFVCMATNGASSDTVNYTLSAALSPTNITWEQVAPSVLLVRWIQPLGKHVM